MKIYKVLALVLSLFMLAFLLIGCSDDSDVPSEQISSTPAEMTVPSEAPEVVTFPLVEETRIFTYWCPLQHASLKSNGDILYWQEMAKKTNIDFEWHHPPANSMQEAFSLMITSQDFDDVIMGFSTYYQGGVDDAISQDIIRSLNDFSKYFPNMWEMMQSDERYLLGSLSDSGYIWGFYCYMSEMQGPWGGPVVRADLLEKYDLPTPVTYSNWEEFLTICRDQEGMTNGPLALPMFATSFLMSTSAGYNVGMATNPIIAEAGKVVNSLLTDRYKQYVTMLSDWFSKGLIQKDFMTSNNYFAGSMSDFSENKIAMGESSYDLSSFSLVLPSYMKIEAIPYPVLNAGDVPHIRQSNPMVSPIYSSSISTNVSNDDDLILLCRYFDYMFSPEGRLLANWGVEDVTFTYDADNKPVYMDLIMNNPDGLSFLDANAVYLGARNATGVYEWTRELTPEVRATMETWLNADDGWVYPSGVTLTPEETAEYTRIWGDCQTLIAEQIIKFIAGIQPMSEWDSFIQQLKDMDIERCTEIRQAALDRYYARISK